MAVLEFLIYFMVISWVIEAFCEMGGSGPRMPRTIP
jgi:hypothetical protein